MSTGTSGIGILSIGIIGIAFSIIVIAIGIGVNSIGIIGTGNGITSTVTAE